MPTAIVAEAPLYSGVDEGIPMVQSGWVDRRLLKQRFQVDPTRNKFVNAWCMHTDRGSVQLRKGDRVVILREVTEEEAKASGLKVL